jgi:hypothetical protein
LALVRDDAAGCTVAGALIAKAKALIEETRTRDHEGIERHYALPALDIALVEARIAILSGQPDSAHPHLAKAKRWIDRGLKVHVPEHAELTASLDRKGARGDTVASVSMDGAQMTGPKKRRWWGLLG